MRGFKYSCVFNGGSVAGVLPFMVLVGVVTGTLVFYDLLLDETVYFGVLFIVLFILIVVTPHYSLIALILFITTLNNDTVLQRYRVYLLDFPVNIIDVGVMLTIVAAGMNATWRKLGRLRFFGFDKPIVGLLGFCVFFTVWGFINSNPIYHILRGVRYPLYLVITYCCTRIIVDRVPQVETVAKAFVIGASIGAVEQIYHFLSSTAEYIGVQVIGVLRDVGFASYFFGLAALMLILARIEYPSFLGPKKIAILLLLNLFGVLVALSRGEWFITAALLSTAPLFVRPSSRAIAGRWVLVAFVGLAGGVIAVDLFLPKSLGLLDLFQGRLLSISGGDAASEGGAYHGRLIGLATEIEAWRHGNLVLGRGFGFWDWFPYSSVLFEDPTVGVYHNSYLFYLVNGGLIGLAFIIWFLLCIIRRSLAIYRLSVSSLANLLSMSLVLSTIFVALMGVSGGLLNQERPVVFMGIFAGMMAALEESNGKDKTRFRVGLGGKN